MPYGNRRCPGTRAVACYTTCPTLGHRRCRQPSADAREAREAPRSGDRHVAVSARFAIRSKRLTLKVSRTESHQDDAPARSFVCVPSLRQSLGKPDRLALFLTLLLALYPAVALNWRGSANGILFVFALIGLFSLPALRDATAPDTRWPSLGAIALFCLTPLLAAVANEIGRGVWVPKNFDLPLRFALLGPCMAAALRMRKDAFHHLQWGVIVGTLISLGRVVYLNRLGPRAAEIGILNTIPFSDISLMLGFLSMLSLGWSITGSRAERFLKVIGFAAGVIASFVSGSRGGWIAIPVLAIVCGVALRPCQSTPQPPASARTRMLCMLGAAMLVLVGVRMGASRIAQAVSDVRAYFHGNVETSIGTRFEIWRASIIALREHPLVGVGFDGFKPVVAGYAHAGRVPLSLIGLPHSHNELLFALATGGIAGGLALLAMYLLPLAYFLQAMRSAPRETRDTRETRCAAGIGATICIGYLISGLTETFFIISMNTALYVFFVATMLAFVHVSRRASARSPQAARP